MVKIDYIAVEEFDQKMEKKLKAREMSPGEEKLIN